MNYQRIYNELITNRQNNPLPKETYTERHHIIPKSHGGSNDKSNLVKLSAREHFIAHWLLWRIHRDNKMANAFNMMCNSLNKDKYINSYAFDEARNSHANTLIGVPKTYEHRRKIGESNMGRILSKETRAKISASRIGKKATDEAKLKMSDSRRGRVPYNKGKTHTEETKAKISNTLLEKQSIGFWKGKQMSEETRYKMSLSRIGKKIKQKIVQCPHCMKVGSNTNMKRYHFDNCNILPNNNGGNRNNIECPYCQKIGVPVNMRRWHFDNCKHRN